MECSIICNLQMKQIVNSCSDRAPFLWNGGAVESVLRESIAALKVNCHEKNIWLSEGNDRRSYEQIMERYPTLTDYEWNTIEIYFGKKTVRKRYREAVLSVVSVFSRLKKWYFPQLPICLYVGVQKGKFQSVTVRFHIMREEGYYLEENLDNYANDAILRCFFPST